VHGHGALNIAVEDKTVTMELEAPGADIVGFEYEAKSDEDKAKVTSAKALLEKPLTLFRMSKAANCNVKSVDVKLEEEGDNHDDHDDHAKEAKDDDHEHDDHAKEEKDDDHAHDDHAKAEKADAHDDHDNEKARHTEFRATYALTCTNPQAITDITFAYFDTFKGAKELDVSVVTDKGQNKFEVERDDPKLSLAGVI